MVPDDLVRLLIEPPGQHLTRKKPDESELVPRVLRVRDEVARVGFGGLRGPPCFGPGEESHGVFDVFPEVDGEIGV